MEYHVETFSLTKTFADWWGRNKVCAVKDLELKVRKNEVYGLLGPNGSGKTTTLKMMLGLLHPTKGRVLVLGGDSRNPKINSRIGYMPEESYLYKYLTARETLDFYGRLFGLARQVRKMRTEALLDMVGLKAVANRQVGTFSKGMARRIGLAQALINDPELLILDEPTTGLDPIGTRQIKDLIIQLAHRGKTVLLCSHLLADVEDVCDRIAILYGGQMQSLGAVQDLLQRTDQVQITAGRISEPALQRIRGIIEEEDGQADISVPMEKLETFFIRTVTKAQESGQKTSGAVSKSEVTDFLAASEHDQTARILDKLVSASVAGGGEEREAVSTKEVMQVEETGPDDKLLSNLTKDVASEKLVTKVEDKEEEVEEEVPERVNRDVLDQLTGGADKADEADADGEGEK